MVCLLKKGLLVLGFASASFVFMSARTVSECKTQLKEIAQDLMDKNVDNPKIFSLDRSVVKEGAILVEEELIGFCNQILLYREDLGSKASDVENIKNELISYLRSFIASGIDLGELDFNFAFIYNAQNPDFTIKFKNPAGEVKTRKYALTVRSIGFKFELVIKINGIMIIGSDFNYYDSANKEYDLGAGLDVGWYPNFLEYEAKSLTNALAEHASALVWYSDDDSKDKPKTKECQKERGFIGICLTSAKIKETNSVLVICGIAFGFGGYGPNFTKGAEAAYVFGGKMTPIKG